MTAATLDKRNRETVRGACGVRVNPEHWASVNVHAFRRWTGDSTVMTWCGLTADSSDGARLTTDLISCSACAQASIKAFREG